MQSSSRNTANTTILFYLFNKFRVSSEPYRAADWIYDLRR